jgi:hypothetical protein
VQPVSKTCDAEQTSAGQASRKHGLAAQAEPGHNPIQGESRNDAAEEAQGLYAHFFDHSPRPACVSRPGFGELTSLDPARNSGPNSVFLYHFVPVYTHLRIECKTSANGVGEVGPRTLAAMSASH